MSRRKFLEPEVQFVNNGWAVARVRGRDTQHAYRVIYRGQYVGWLLHAEDGWRWQVNWRPGRATFTPRVSTGVYGTWQEAASLIGRTDVARAIAGRGNGPKASEWTRPTGVRVEPWTPRPAKPEEVTR